MGNLPRWAENVCKTFVFLIMPLAWAEILNVLQSWVDWWYFLTKEFCGLFSCSQACEVRQHGHQIYSWKESTKIHGENALTKSYHLCQKHSYPLLSHGEFQVHIRCVAKSLKVHPSCCLYVKIIWRSIVMFFLGLTC